MDKDLPVNVNGRLVYVSQSAINNMAKLKVDKHTPCCTNDFYCGDKMAWKCTREFGHRGPCIAFSNIEYPLCVWFGQPDFFIASLTTFMEVSISEDVFNWLMPLDTTEDEQACAHNFGFICTRPVRHEGPHIAFGLLQPRAIEADNEYTVYAFIHEGMKIRGL